MSVAIRTQNPFAMPHRDIRLAMQKTKMAPPIRLAIISRRNRQPGFGTSQLVFSMAIATARAWIAQSTSAAAIEALFSFFLPSLARLLIRRPTGNTRDRSSTTMKQIKKGLYPSMKMVVLNLAAVGPTETTSLIPGRLICCPNQYRPTRNAVVRNE